MRLFPRLVAQVNVFSLLKYLGREFLLILSTSSSETALPRLIAKMEHAGVSQPVTGIVVPTGSSCRRPCPARARSRHPG